MSRPPLPLPCRAAGHGLVWSDDPADPDYNTGQVSHDYPFSHEKLRRSDPLYDLVAITDFNCPEPVPGAGSAIFVHLWRRPRFPTAGCVAFARRDLDWILTRWSNRSRLVIRLRGGL